MKPLIAPDHACWDDGETTCGCPSDGARHDADVADMQRIIAPILKQLYPQNPDVVLGREARIIAAALWREGIR